LHHRKRNGQRDVAQPGRVRVWGARGRKFESCHPDPENEEVSINLLASSCFHCNNTATILTLYKHDVSQITLNKGTHCGTTPFFDSL
jgi:hypothetical protein